MLSLPVASLLYGVNSAHAWSPIVDRDGHARVFEYVQKPRLAASHWHVVVPLDHIRLQRNDIILGGCEP